MFARPRASAQPDLPQPGKLQLAHLRPTSRACHYFADNCDGPLVFEHARLLAAGSGRRAPAPRIGRRAAPRLGGAGEEGRP
eukprot:2826624-Pyramimonas_sp.AAC.1